VILADTSVWLDHWRRPNARLTALLAQNRIAVHPFVVGEIALRAIAPRAEILRRLSRLHTTTIAQQREVLDLIERIPLWGTGIGWVDAHLLASALLDRIPLWTLDAALARVAGELGTAVNPG